MVLGNGNIRLEIRPSVSEVDESRGVEANGVNVPGLTERFTDTSVELRAGQTLALAGLIQYRTESLNKGVPWLADMPWIGRAFSRVEQQTNEVELLIIVTPELVGAMEPHQVPQCGPGQMTTHPNDEELYNFGYLEVPDCCLGSEGGPAVQPAPNGTPKSIPVPRGGAAPRPNTAPLPRHNVTPNATPPSVGAESMPPLRSPSASTRAGSQHVRPSGQSGQANETGIFGPLGYDPLD